MSQVPQKTSLLLLSLPFPFIVFLVSPLSFYFTNLSEYTIPLYCVLSLLCPATCLGTLTLYGLLRLALLEPSRHAILCRLIAGLACGLAVAAWLQSQILGATARLLLDGQKLDWYIWGFQADIEFTLWILILAASLWLAFKSFKTLILCAQAMLWLGCISTIASGVTSPILASLSASPHEQHLRDANQGSGIDHLFSFDHQNNVILIVLDTFQADVFQEIAERWPDEVNFLKDFVFYPNTLGGFPGTATSIPLIITGQFYQNELPLDAWSAKQMASWNIADDFASKGYGVSLASVFTSQIIDRVKTGACPLAYLKRKGIITNSHETLNVLDGGIFKSCPLKYKHYLYNGGRWLLTTLFADHQIPPGRHGYDLSLLQAFEHYAKVQHYPVGAFRYYHYAATHTPLEMNARFEYIPVYQELNRAVYLEQARGALTILKRMFARLKALNVYDAAHIVVIGDHGSRLVIPSDMHPGKTVDERVLKAARPLFLRKRSTTDPTFQAIKTLEISDNPMHLADIPYILSGRKPCTKKRTFYFYDMEGPHATDHVPTMTEYRVGHDVRDPSLWEKVTP